eukprot:gene3241-biopygen8345
MARLLPSLVRHLRIDQAVPVKDLLAKGGAGLAGVSPPSMNSSRLDGKGVCIVVVHAPSPTGSLANATEGQMLQRVRDHLLQMWPGPAPQPMVEWIAAGYAEVNTSPPLVCKRYGVANTNTSFAMRAGPAAPHWVRDGRVLSQAWARLKRQKG